MQTNHPFMMPMFRAFVPRRIQPWIYLVQVMCIQFSGGVYLGALEAVRGTTNLMIEDLLMLLYTGLAGMAVWFPMLFRMKFRFTNQQLLCGAAAVIGICNFITMCTTNMAILLPVCFIAGIAKIQGTFECMSNIQLWITPPRDFGVFFPVLHIVLLTAITGSAWLAAVVAFHLPWQMMHVLTIGMMCFVVLVQLTLCKPFCPMPQRMSLKGIDITTGLLMSVLMLMVSYFLVYGDYLMWFRSPRLRWIVALALILLAFTLYRLKTVEKPYISLEIFRYKNVIPILLVTVVAEVLLGAEHTLEEIYWSEVRGLEEHTKTGLCLWSLPGVYAGVVITLFWLGHRKWKVWKLFAIGFGFITAYALWMYFKMDVNVPITAYRWALVFRGCAYAVLAVSLMWSLHESVHELEHFFMALFIFNVIHMYLAGASGYGLYTSLFQHFMADNMSRYGSYLTLTGVDMQQFDMNGFMNGYYLHSMMSVTLKQIFGQIIWAAGFMTMAFLLLDIPRVRTGIEKVPYWPVYGIKMLARMKNPIFFTFAASKDEIINMRKNVLIIFALIMLSACHNRQTQAESAGAAVADSTEVMAPEETDLMASHPQSYSMTGTIGEDKASIVLDKNGNDVTGVVTRCDYCVPINVEGTWQGDNITVDGVSQAGSHIEYRLTVTGNAVQGAEILSAEGEVEKQNVTMTIEHSRN